MSAAPAFTPMPRGQRDRYRSAAPGFSVAGVPGTVELFAMSGSVASTLSLSPGAARAVAAELLAAAEAVDLSDTVCSAGLSATPQEKD